MSLTNAPTLRSERLILRGPEPGDFEPLAAFFADTERSPGFGGPKDRNEAWRWWASSIGHWHLHGFGYWTITDADGAVLGITGLWYPEGWPEIEMGWVAVTESEGKGVMTEAATLARAHVYATLGLPALSSNIKPDNARSIRLAERLGCVLERRYRNISHGDMLLYRHPGPAEVAA